MNHATVRAADGALRILYDAYWWDTGPHSGRVVVREILRAWRRVFPDDVFVLAVRPADRASVVAEFPDARIAKIRGRPHGIAVITQFAWHAWRQHVDVAYTQNFAPPGVWSVTFIHDVLFQTNPKWFTLPERAYFSLIPTFARTARLVLTSSASEVDRIRECNPRLRRVSGIGLAVSTELTDAVPIRPAVAADIDNFVLAVGRLNARKNLSTTLEAALASGVLSRARPLIVIGESDGRSADLGDVVDAVDDGIVRFVSRVSDGELAWLYSHADLFINLSLGEGFGLPPVEAISFGCPTIVSDLRVYRENLHDLATFVDPLDVETIAAAIHSVPTRRHDPAPVFPTWEDCATKARAAIVDALGPRRSSRRVSFDFTPGDLRG